MNDFERLKKNPIMTGLGVAGVVIFLFGFGLWAHIYAWWNYPDLSLTERQELFEQAVMGFSGQGVTVRRDDGSFLYLTSSSVAKVQDGTCEREANCLSSRRRSCRYVSVTYTCTYPLTDVDGHAGTAVVVGRSNEAWRMGVNIPGSEERIGLDAPRFDEARDILCKRGLGCGGSITAVAAGSAPDTFTDCRDGFCGPEMVRVPAGRGVMGSSEKDIERLVIDDPSTTVEWHRHVELPQHPITIANLFAVQKTEVTFALWDACVADKVCPAVASLAEVPNRAQLPVIEVSWADITAKFLPWLNGRLGLNGQTAYRLPTETEWEYAARAGSAKTFAYGDTLSSAQARFQGFDLAPVGTLQANAFGVHDVHGNAAEWVQDCYEAGYAGAPTDGSERLVERCSSRVIRGGSWQYLPRQHRASYRRFRDPEKREYDVGFRLARTLPQP
jgi:formylglycine-generating enzyme required for sulfatase activity